MPKILTRNDNGTDSIAAVLRDVVEETDHGEYQSAIGYYSDDGRCALLLFFRDEQPTLESELAFYCVPPEWEGTMDKVAI